MAREVRGSSSDQLVEALEGRRMLSVSAGGAVLKVGGTRDDDVIAIGVNAADPGSLDVSVNGEVRTVSAARLRRIRASGGAGDDVIRLGAGVSLSAVLLGGAGDDELTGAAGADVVIGGKGDDDLGGGAGTDRIVGGQGEDVFQSADAAGEYADLRGDDGIRIAITEAQPAVQATVNSLIQGGTLRNLLRETDDGAEVYELEWNEPGPHSAKTTPDGTVIELEVEIDPATLPAAVTNAITTRYPRGTVTEAETIDVPGQPQNYEVEVENGRLVRELVVSAAGEILADEVEGRVGG
jgi:YD repeat-containing protein